MALDERELFDELVFDFLSRECLLELPVAKSHMEVPVPVACVSVENTPRFGTTPKRDEHAAFGYSSTDISDLVGVEGKRLLESEHGENLHQEVDPTLRPVGFLPLEDPRVEAFHEH